MNKPLREHYETPTDAGNLLQTFRYIEDLENYIEYLEKIIWRPESASASDGELLPAEGVAQNRSVENLLGLGYSNEQREKMK